MSSPRSNLTPSLTSRSTQTDVSSPSSPPSSATSSSTSPPSYITTPTTSRSLVFDSVAPSSVGATLSPETSVVSVSPVSSEVPVDATFSVVGHGLLAADGGSFPPGANVGTEANGPTTVPVAVGRAVVMVGGTAAHAVLGDTPEGGLSTRDGRGAEVDGGPVSRADLGDAAGGTPVSPEVLSDRLLTKHFDRRRFFERERSNPLRSQSFPREEGTGLGQGPSAVSGKRLSREHAAAMRWTAVRVVAERVTAARAARAPAERVVVRHDGAAPAFPERDRRAGAKEALMEHPAPMGVRPQRALSSLELGLAKERSDCVNGDGAATVGGTAQYDSPPASPSYSPQPSPDRSDDEEESMETFMSNTIIGLRAALIADHMVRMVALDELFAAIDIVVAQYNGAAAATPPVAEMASVGEQVAALPDVVVPTDMAHVPSVETYSETEASLALAYVQANSGVADAPAEDPADWSAGEDEDDDDEDDDVLLDDVVEQDQLRQVLEERAVRTTYTALEQLAAAGVHRDWDCVYGHAEFLVTCGGPHAQDDDFIVSKLLDTHSGV